MQMLLRMKKMKNRVIVWLKQVALVALFMSAGPMAAQNMTVESFRPLENDLTAITNGTMEFDQNGNVAALIKIVVSGTGFTFDVGSLGIVKTRQMGKLVRMMELLKVTILGQNMQRKYVRM